MVCCVIVTYRTGEIVRSVLESILPQVGHAVVVDNGSDPDTVRPLLDLAASLPGKLTVRRNERNAGLAAALNDGIRTAFGLGYEWILTLDHDSVAAPGMVEGLLSTWREVSDRNPGIVAPAHVDRESGRKYRYVTFGRFLFRSGSPGGGPLRASFSMSSGSLARREVFEKVGMFREDFFVYGIDKEFCRRVVRAGYSIFISDRAVLHHQEGVGEEIRFLSLVYRSPGWGAQSLYYVFRNNSYDLRDDPVWSSRFHNLFFLAKIFGSILLSRLPEKRKRLRAAIRGISDALAGRLGPAPPME